MKILQKIIILTLILSLWCLGADKNTKNTVLAEDSSLSLSNTWRPIPLRSAKQKELIMDGGEGMQMAHGFSYAPSSPNIIYMVVDTSQVWKSVDGGTSWVSKRTGFKANGGISIAVDPLNKDVVYVAGSLSKADGSETSSVLDGIYRTLNGGNNWQRVSASSSYFKGSDGDIFAFDPDSYNSTLKRHKTVYAGTHKEGLLKSIDGGDTWAPTGFLVGERISDIALHKIGLTTVIYIATTNKLAETTGKGLYKFIDNGTLPSISPLANNLPAYPRTITIVPQSSFESDTIYTAVGTFGIYKSTNGGANFSSINTDLTINTKEFTQISISPVDSRYIYIKRHKADSTFFYSNNGGSNWSSPATLDKTNSAIVGTVTGYYGIPYGLHPQYPKTAITHSEGTIVKTIDGGNNWAYSGNGFMGGRRSKGKTATYFDPANSSRPSNQWRMIYFLIDYGPALTEDGGSTWALLPIPRKNGALSTPVGAVDPTNPNVIITAVGSWSGTNPGYTIIKTTTGGKLSSSWYIPTIAANSSPATDDFQFMAFDPQDPMVVYAGAGGNSPDASWISRDKGETWTKTSGKSIRAVSQDGSIVYAIEERGSPDYSILWRSYNKGLSWDSGTSTQFGSIEEMNVDPTNNNRLYVAANGIWVFNGSTWPEIGKGPGKIPSDTGKFHPTSIVIDPINPNILYVGMGMSYVGHRDSAIYRSINFGQTWEDIGFDFGGYSTVWSLAINPLNGDLHMSSSHGNYVLNGPSDTTAPTTPTNLTASEITTSSVKLTWEASTDNIKVTGYKIYRDETLLQTITDGTITAYSDSGLASNTFYSYAASAFDAAGNESAQSLAISIMTLPSPNNPPILFAIGNKIINENSLLTISLSGSDADNDTLTYSAVNLPQGSSLLGNTFTWTSDYTQAGSYSTTFMVSDNKDIDMEDITITVNNTNRAPVLNSIGNHTVEENKIISFTVSASDADDDPLTVTAQGLNPWMSFDGAIMTISPDYTNSGTYAITFTASDGSLTDSETINIEVLDIAPPDTTPPTVPQEISAEAASSSQINLSWGASTDDVGVAGYKIYRNGNLIITSSSLLTYYQDINLQPSTTYDYAISAIDIAGNESDLSTAIETTMDKTSDKITIQSGEDWSLPSWAEKWSPYGKIFMLWYANSISVNNPNVDIYPGEYSWREIQTGPNTFNWTLIDNKIEEVKAAGKKFIFWYSGGRGDESKIPQWLITAYPNTPTYQMYGETHYKLWLSGMGEELKNFAAKFGKRYKNNPTVAFSYFTQEPGVIQGKGGIPKEEWLPFYKELLEVWANSLGKEKVIESGRGANVQSLDELAISLGANVRSGGGYDLTTELATNFLWLDRAFDFGTGYAKSINQPTVFYGTDNEEIANDYEYARLIYLTTLSERFNYHLFNRALYSLEINQNVTINNLTYDGSKFAPLRDYVRKVQGYPPEKSPDAYAVLREMNLPWGQFKPAKNIERFLYQRDGISGGRTKRAEEKTWNDPVTANLYSAKDDIGAEARSTDKATGNNYIYFGVDDQFIKGGSSNIAIKVYYKDTGTAKWRIEYDAANNDFKQTDSVVNTNSNEWKTATFTINDAQFNNEEGLANGVDLNKDGDYSDEGEKDGLDFRIHNNGPEDIIIGMVRVLRLDEPNVPDDTTPPTTPQGISAVATSSSQINLSWGASTDNKRVTGYKIYRDNILLTTKSSLLTTYQDTNLQPNTTYTFNISAIDAAGNESAQSTTKNATTDAPPKKTYYIRADGTTFQKEAATSCSSAASAMNIHAHNKQQFVGGDTIVLCSEGGTYRTTTLIVPSSGSVNNPITYTAGQGGIPDLRRSILANSSDNWIDKGGNIWELNYPFGNSVGAGNLSFNNDTSFGVEVFNAGDLDKPGEWWMDDATNDNKMRIYSSLNPATIYKNIEIMIHEDIFKTNGKSHINIENLNINHGGWTCLRIEDQSSNIIINNNKVSYCGGGHTESDPDSRHGNGIDILRSANNITIKNNEVWQIYDSGIAMQGYITINRPPYESLSHNNIFIHHNIVKQCGANYEFWSKYDDAKVHNIYFENNTLYDAGGWSQEPGQRFGQETPQSGHGIKKWASNGNISNFFIRNNIIHTAFGHLMDFNYMSLPSKLTFNYNNYYPDRATSFAIAGAEQNFIDWKNYYRPQDANSINGDPLFVSVSGSNFNLSDLSPAIDAGISTSSTVDRAGNPIYGAPDLGAYEYQPPYTMGTNKIDADQIDTTGNIRIYANGKFRNKSAPSGIMAEMSITPKDGFISNNYSEWMNVVIEVWDKTDTYTKKWKEFSNILENNITAHTIGDLQPNKLYSVWYQKDGAPTKIKLIDLTADSNGRIFFDYGLGYPNVEFEITNPSDNTPPTTPTNLTAQAISSSQIDLTWSASIDNVGVVGYKIYRNRNLIANQQPPATIYTDINLQSSTSYTYNISAIDAAGNESAQSASINVATLPPPNNPPILSAIGNQTIEENRLLTITLSAADADNDTLTYSGSNMPQGATLLGNTFTWTPNYTQAGSYVISFIVSDGKGMDSEDITVTVNNVNRPPVALGQALVINEDTAKTIVLNGSDPDSDALTYSVATLPVKGVLLGTAPNLTYTPNKNYNGTDSFTFKVNDGKVDSGIVMVSITVNPVNDAPVLASIGNKSTNEVSLLTFILSASDVDGDKINYSASGLPRGASIDISSGVFSWTPDYTQAGSYAATFTVSDGKDSASETITITVNNTNRAPVLSPIGNRTIEENKLLTITLSAADADNDTLIYSGSNMPQGANVIDNKFTWTPNYYQAGSYTIILSVADSSLSDSETVTIRVLDVDITPPEIIITEPVNNFLTNKNSITLKGTIDGINFSEERSLPLEGKNTITKEAIDAAGNTASKSITIIKDTIPPALEIISPENNLITYQKSITLSYTLDGLPKSETRNLIEGNNTITVSAADAAGNTTSKSITVIYELSGALTSTTFNELSNNPTEIKPIENKTLNSTFQIINTKPEVTTKPAGEISKTLLPPEIPDKFLPSGKTPLIPKAIKELEIKSESLSENLTETAPSQPSNINIISTSTTSGNLSEISILNAHAQPIANYKIKQRGSLISLLRNDKSRAYFYIKEDTLQKIKLKPSPGVSSEELKNEVEQVAAFLGLVHKQDN